MSCDQKRNRQRGMAVVTVLFIIAVLLVLATALITVVISHSQMTVNTENRQKAYDVAESGIADVAAKIRSGAIVASGGTTQSGSGTVGSDGSYTWTVAFNTSVTVPVAVPNPLRSATSCNAVSQTQPDPGPDCVTIPAKGAFLAVTGSYQARSASVEAMMVPGQFSIGTKTIIAGQVYQGYGQIVGSASGVHDVDALGNCSPDLACWLAAIGSTVDGTAATTNSYNQANAITKLTNVAPIQLPSVTDVSKAAQDWIAQAKANNCYWYPSQLLNKTTTVPHGAVCYIDGNMNYVSGSYPWHVVNDGGLLVVGGSFIFDLGLSQSYSLTAACSASCDCHRQAQLITGTHVGVSAPLGSNTSFRNFGTGASPTQSVGVVFAASGPFHDEGNLSLAGAVVSRGQFTLSGSFKVDPCTHNAVIPLGAKGLTAYGQY